jgi:hypothetical protein
MVETPARYCSNCGHALNTGDRFCPNCGRPVQETATVPTPEADVPVPPPPQAGGSDAAPAQAPLQESVRRGLSNPYNLGCLGVVGFLLFAVVIAAIIGGVRHNAGSADNSGGGGDVAEKPKQERQAVQQEQPQKKEPEPQQEEQRAQGAQEEQPRGEQKSEPREPNPQQSEPREPEPREPEPREPSFGDGTHQVGTDVQPGIYRTRAGSPNCYWERLRNFSGGLNGILANGNTSAPAIVTIEQTDAGFHSEGCGTWTKDLSAITASKTSFGAGAYIVGTDMIPGTYRNSGGANCYYERLRGFNGGLNAIIANGNTSNPTIVAIAPTDAGFQSNGCGTWTKLE